MKPEVRQYWDPDMREIHEYTTGVDRGWEGYALILRLLRRVLKPPREMFSSVFDLRARRGGVLQQCHSLGIEELHGLDPDEANVAEVLEERLEGLIEVGRPESADLGMYERHDLVVGFEMMERTFPADIDAALRFAISIADRWIVLNILTVPEERTLETFEAAKRGDDEVYDGQTYTALDGSDLAWVEALGAADVPLAHMWQMVSGLLVVQPVAWWAERFEEAGLVVRWDLMTRYEIERRQHGHFREIPTGSLQPREPIGAVPMSVDAGLLDQLPGWGIDRVFILEVER